MTRMNKKVEHISDRIKKWSVWLFKQWKPRNKEETAETEESSAHTFTKSKVGTSGAYLKHQMLPATKSVEELSSKSAIYASVVDSTQISQKFGVRWKE